MKHIFIKHLKVTTTEHVTQISFKSFLCGSYAPDPAVSSPSLFASLRLDERLFTEITSDSYCPTAFCFSDVSCLFLVSDHTFSLFQLEIYITEERTRPRRIVSVHHNSFCLPSAQMFCTQACVHEPCLHVHQKWSASAQFHRLNDAPDHMMRCICWVLGSGLGGGE